METPPAPPHQDLIFCEEKLGGFLFAKVSSLLEPTSGNSALGQGFSDLVHGNRDETSGNTALERGFSDSS